MTERCQFVAVFACVMPAGHDGDHMIRKRTRPMDKLETPDPNPAEEIVIPAEPAPGEDGPTPVSPDNPAPDSADPIEDADAGDAPTGEVRRR